MSLHFLKSEIIAIREALKTYIQGAGGITSTLDGKASLSSRSSEKGETLERYSGKFIFGEVSKAEDGTDGVDNPRKTAKLLLGKGSSIRTFDSPSTDEDLVSAKYVKGLLNSVQTQLSSVLKFARGFPTAYYYEYFPGKTSFTINPASVVSEHPDAREYFRLNNASMTFLKPGVYEVDVHVAGATMASTNSQPAELRLFVTGSPVKTIDRVTQVGKDVRLNGTIRVMGAGSATIDWLMNAAGTEVSVSLNVKKIGE